MKGQKNTSMNRSLKKLALRNISVLISMQRNQKNKSTSLMKAYFKQLTETLRRPVYLLGAASVLFGALSVVMPVEAGQVQSRKIMMSDNGASGNSSITSGVGSGTNVTYRVVFKAATSFTVKGVVVDFCSGSGTPFIGDSTCPAPTSFTVGATPTTDVTDWTVGSTTIAGLNTGTWTNDSLSSGQTFRMVNSTGVSLTANTDYTFAITGVTNPSTTGTFYARIMLYNSDTGSVASYTHGTPGSYTDYGGFALSTAAIVQVTAKVQETLTFCVSGYSNAAGAPATQGAGTPPTDCSDATAPAIILGHGTNNTLDASQVDINNVWTYVSTNALHGVSIRMRNSNACGGLSTDGGTTCDIGPASAGSGTTISTIAKGNALFGMACRPVSAGSGTVACDANYNDGTVGPETLPITTATTAHYGMDNSTTGDNVTTTYGDVVAASTAPVNSVITQYDFAASASNTTPAGIYRANLAMIATGTF